MRRAKDRGPPRGGAARPLPPAAPTRSRLPKESSSPRSGPVSVPWWPASLQHLLDLYPPRPPYRSPYCWSPPLRLVHALHTAAEGKRRLLWRSPRPIRLGATLFFSGPPFLLLVNFSGGLPLGPSAMDCVSKEGNCLDQV